MKKINNTYTCKNCVFFDETIALDKLFFDLENYLFLKNFSKTTKIMDKNFKLYTKYIGKNIYKGNSCYCRTSNLYIDYFPEIDKIYIPYIGKICEKFKYDFYKNIRKILDERR